MFSYLCNILEHGTLHLLGKSLLHRKIPYKRWFFFFRNSSFLLAVQFYHHLFHNSLHHSNRYTYVYKMSYKMSSKWMIFQMVQECGYALPQICMEVCNIKVSNHLLISDQKITPAFRLESITKNDYIRCIQLEHKSLHEPSVNFWYIYFGSI